MSNSQCPPEDVLKQFLDGSLGPDDERRTDAHVSTCHACETRLVSLMLAWAEHPLAEPDEVAPPDAVDGYTIGPELARGGMGIVYLGHDPAFGRDIAIKTVRTKLAGSPAARGRFLREARIAGRLQHPGIPPIHRVGTLPDGRPYLAMKLIRGQTLDAQPHGAAGLLDTFESVARAVGYAHAHGIIHRDLKPQNVMVGEFGEVQVMDWGLAKELVETAEDSADPSPASVDASQLGSIVGTPSFMAPEQARVEAVDARADVFGLGGLLAFVLTGQPVYSGVSRDDVLEAAAAGDLSGIRGHLAACGAESELIGLAIRCLSIDPSDRPANGGAVAEWVADYRHRITQQLRAAETERAAAAVRDVEQRRRRRVVVRAAVGIVAALTLGLAFSLWQMSRARSEATRADQSAGVALHEAERSRDALEKSLASHERLIGMVENEMIAHGKPTTGSRRLLRDAIEGFRSLIDRNSDRPEVRHRNGLAHMRLGELHRLLGESQEGISQVRTAIDLFEGLTADHPDTVAYRACLAEAFSSAGFQVHHERAPAARANKKEANELCERAVGLWEEVTRIDARTEYLAQQAAANYRLAVIARDQNDHPRARVAFEAARRWQVKTLEQDPREPKHRSELAQVCNSMAYYLTNTGEAEAGRECAAVSVSTLRDMVGKDGDDLRDEVEWYLAHRLLINHARANNQPDRAMELLMAVLPVTERLANLNPRNNQFARQLAGIQREILHAQSVPTDVAVWAAKVISTLGPLYRGSQQPRLNDWDGLLDCYSRRAQAFAGLKRFAEALRDHDEGIALIKAWQGRDKHRQPDFLRERYRDRTRWQMALGRYREAALDADDAAKLAAPAEAWRDQLNAAEARALDGRITEAYSSATVLEKHPHLEVIHALNQLTIIYDLHSDYLSKNTYVRAKNDLVIIDLLTRSLGKTAQTEIAARMSLHQRRAQRYEGAKRWDEAGDDWEVALKLMNPKQNPRVSSEYREKASWMRYNAGKPAEAMRLLEPLGQDVPQDQLYPLAFLWARIAGHDKLLPPVSDEASRQSLALLESILQRKVPFRKPLLDFIEKDAVFAPVRKLAAYKEWRDAMAPTVK